MNNITLIGMPGAGKSSIGVVLAKVLGYQFIDSDLIIQKEEKRTLSEIIEQDGIDGFKAVENRVNASIQVENTVIATGGSVVYCDEAMQHLKSEGIVVYLKISLKLLSKRLGDLKGRGVLLKEGQTLESLRDTLGKLLALRPMPQHVSAYSLIVEEGTPFARMAERGELQLPEEDTERAMYEETREILAKYGFHRYEISNYARDGYECLHNVGYWIRRDYLGFGIGAASLVDNVRFQNGRDLITYLENPQDCREEEQVLTEQEQMEETMFLGLRLIRGISYEQFEKQYGRSLPEVYGPVITQNIADGLLREYTEESGERFLALTEKGLDVSNYVMAQFLF